jgi:hypothetical protein
MFFNDKDVHELVAGLILFLKILCLFALDGLAIIVSLHFVGPPPAAARPYCYRPEPYMMGTQSCTRVPTVQKPYCPMP